MNQPREDLHLSSFAREKGSFEEPPRDGIIRDQVAVLSVAEGFFQSSVLFALLKLRVFERIGDGGKTLDELAAELAARPETLARLLNAGVLLLLLETQDGLTYR